MSDPVERRRRRVRELAGARLDDERRDALLEGLADPDWRVARAATSVAGVREDARRPHKTTQDHATVAHRRDATMLIALHATAFRHACISVVHARHLTVPARRDHEHRGSARAGNEPEQSTSQRLV